MSQNNKINVALFTNHPSQWESPFFGFFNQKSDIKLDIYYETKLGLNEGFEEESNFKVNFDIPEILEHYDYYFYSSDNPFQQILKELPFKYDAFIVEGHAGIIKRQMILYGLLNKIPMIYRSDTTLLYNISVMKRTLKRMMLPTFFSFFKAFLPLSSPASIFLKQYGVKDEMIFVAPYMLNNDWYYEMSEMWRKNPNELKSDLGLSKFNRIALAILRFEDRENPIEFLIAAELLKEKIPDLGFVLIGDGNQRKQVEEFIKAKKLENVVLPGYLKLSNLPKYYALADVFVHPAKEECWGLSVNEAIASSVPVIVSNGLGCRFDLLPSEKYGFTYPLGDANTLAILIEKIISDKILSADICINAKQKIEEVSYNRALKEFENAIAFALSAK